jgi:hypothetical protein
MISEALVAHQDLRQTFNDCFILRMIGTSGDHSC